MQETLLLQHATTLADGLAVHDESDPDTGANRYVREGVGLQPGPSFASSLKYAIGSN